jgi:Type I phosphodiesterase / nucleotide pyrophosphatase
MRRVFLVLLAGLVAATGAFGSQRTVPSQADTGVRLVLLIAIDQFRYDYLTRFRSEYTHGLRTLLTRGAVFTNAWLEHYPTVTAVGHATMLSGATPSVSGIIGNDWFDRASGKTVTSVSDESVRLLGGTGAASSPERLLVSTIGDELKMASRAARGSDQAPRVIGISAKDRGAILPVGRGADAAYWIDASGAFVSSTYYFTELPAWVSAFNAARSAGTNGQPRPPINELILSFARQALVVERLGRRGAVDLLSVSFSQNDAVGHTHGPDSPDVRTITLETDRQLSDLLSTVDQQVGLSRTLIALTADHGVAPVPEVMAERRMPGGRLQGQDVFGPVQAALERRFGAGDWLVATAGSSPYLNYALIAERGLDAAEVRRVAADAAMTAPRVVRVYTRDQLLRGAVAPDLLGRRVLRGFNAQRSGDLEILLEPYWMRAARGTTHGTPYNYDAHIPLIFMGPGIKAGRFHQRAALNDLAPTLATMLDIEMPSGADGRVLSEMFSDAPKAGVPRRAPTPTSTPSPRSSVSQSVHAP